MAGDWQWSPLGIPGPHSAITKSFPVGTPLGVWGKLCVFNGLAEAPVVSTFFSGTWKPNF
jgi:hypothetical protein